MSFSLRPLIGFSAAFATMAAVLVAGSTTPSAKPAVNASAGCTKAPMPSPMQIRAGSPV
ncbi:MAG: hypothetical protein ABL956_16845 [Hyphomonadaceae bacterium]